MDTELIIEMAAILVLVLANGFFAMSEFSIIASRRSKLHEKVDQGKRGARKAVALHQKPDKFLATIQVGITMIGTLAGVFGGVTIVKKLEATLADVSVAAIAAAAGPLAIGIVTVAIAVTTVVLGELVPKYLALSFPERYARYVSRPITIFIKLTSFISSALSGAANLIVRLLGVSADGNDNTVSEDEINLMIFEGRQKGVFDETEEKLIHSVFDFADSTVRRAMTPRTDVEAIDLNSAPTTVIDTVIEHGYSRYPVFENTIDNIVGVLYTKDLILQRLDPKLIVLHDLIRKPTFVPDSMPLSRLLGVFRRKKGQLVLDEYGGTAGIATLQDVIEELVGEIQDEDDAGSSELVKHSDLVAFADGSVWPGAVNELMDSHLPEENVDTLAGLVFDHLGHLPKKNETVTIADMKITILELIDNRLSRLKLEKPHKKKSSRRNNGT